jgi:hypothetical protein
MAVGAIATSFHNPSLATGSQSEQPAAAINSKNSQGNPSLVFKSVDESSKSSKTQNRHDPDDQVSETEENEVLQWRFGKKDKRIGTLVDRYV